MPDIKANQNYNKARQNMCIPDGILCTYSTFCANDHFLTNTVSFLWNRTTNHGFMQDEFWDRAFYLHNIAIWRAQEPTTNWYSNYKTKLNKTMCIFYGMYCVCSNGSIRSQRSLLLTWSPSDASPLTKPFMPLVNKACRPTTITWAIIMETYHLVTSMQVVWNQDIRGWTAMFVPWPLLLKEIGETIIKIWTWISNDIAMLCH